MRDLGYTSFNEYCEHLVEHDWDGSERIAMVNAITPTKTEFFREAHHFDIVRSRLVPDAIARVARGAAARLRLWSAGCSTGQEPYSLAMSVLDAALDPAAWDIRILASDINSDALAVAQAGVYPEAQVATVDRATRRRHFERVPDAPGDLRVVARVRDIVQFGCINLCQVPWPIQMAFDAIFCRKVLVYFDRATRVRLVGHLVERLKPGGYLFLDDSESPLDHGLGLTEVGHTVYAKPE
jgi:chemotaxis protein methyltransferase CheR